MAFKDIAELAGALRRFAGERDWEQFHSPRNLAASLAVEAGEVLEHFQWLTEEQSEAAAREKKEQIALELADVLMHLVRLADRMEVDLLEAAGRKLEINEKKYPVHLARGKNRKYTDL
jgi:NTP pyrophosphatase (non-canonical NTP hydrolase)